LLEEGKIAYTKAGKHRRIKYEDVINSKKKWSNHIFDEWIDFQRTFIQLFEFCVVALWGLK